MNITFINQYGELLNATAEDIIAIQIHRGEEKVERPMEETIPTLRYAVIWKNEEDSYWPNEFCGVVSPPPSALLEMIQESNEEEGLPPFITGIGVHKPQLEIWRSTAGIVAARLIPWDNIFVLCLYDKPLKQIDDMREPGQSRTHHSVFDERVRDPEFIEKHIVPLGIAGFEYENERTIREDYERRRQKTQEEKFAREQTLLKELDAYREDFDTDDDFKLAASLVRWVYANEVTKQEFKEAYNKV